MNNLVSQIVIVSDIMMYDIRKIVCTGLETFSC